jgi:hypothetical protein
LTCSTGGENAVLSVCQRCRALVFEPHTCVDGKLTLLSWPSGAFEQWFGDFVARDENQLDPTLVTVLGVAELEERARRGDFGTVFRERWLRYQRARARQQIIAALRDGVQKLRQSGSDVDIGFDARSARLSWRSTSCSVKP